MDQEEALAKLLAKYKRMWERLEQEIAEKQQELVRLRGEFRAKEQAIFDYYGAVRETARLKPIIDRGLPKE